MLSPCRLACEALGLPPIGRPWSGSEPAICALEGIPLPNGTPVAPFAPGTNFMDDADLVNRDGIISGWAVHFLAKHTMAKLQRVVVTRKAVYPIARDEHRTWFLLTPPDPPFVAFVSDSTLQHLAWRTPITESKDLIYVRLGPRLLRIRRPLVIEAVDRFRAWGNRYLRALDRDLKSTRTGLLPDEVPPEARAFLARLGPGELWALATLAKANPVPPVQPDPIML